MNDLIPQELPSKANYSLSQNKLVNRIPCNGQKQQKNYNQRTLPIYRSFRPCDNSEGTYLLDRQNSQLSNHDKSILGGRPSFYTLPTKPNNSTGVVYIELPSGTANAVCAVMALLLWCYSIYRLYIAWKKTINFSVTSIQGLKMGWEMLAHWIDERIRRRKLKVF